jgi:hypothetical protein
LPSTAFLRCVYSHMIMSFITREGMARVFKPSDSELTERETMRRF